MLIQILTLVLETFFGLFILVLLARFYMQAFRASFRSPVGSFVLALSNWIVLPARKFIPSMLGLDMASLVIAWLAETLLLFLLFSLTTGFGAPPEIVTGLLFIIALLELVRYSIYLLMAVVILQALLSWINPYSAAAPTLNALTRPFYRVFQRLIPPIGGLDLSPLFLLVLLQIVLVILTYSRPTLTHML